MWNRSADHHTGQRLISRRNKRPSTSALSITHPNEKLLAQRAATTQLIVDRGMDCGECLEAAHGPEALHGAHSLEWQMRVLDAIVQPSTHALLFRRIQFSKRSVKICAAHPRPFMNFLRICNAEALFHHDVTTASCTALRGQLHARDIAARHGSPQRHHQRATSTSNMRAIARPALSYLSGKHRTEAVPPLADGSLVDINPALVQQSSTFRSDRGNLTSSITARRIISGLVLKHLKWSLFGMSRRYETTLPASSRLALTVPS